MNKHEKQIRALVKDALVMSAESTRAADAAGEKAEGMSQALLKVAKLCSSAEDFRAATSKDLGPWLKSEEGQAWCKQNNVPVTFSDKTGAVILPKRFKQLTTNILRGMLDHENPELRDEHGKPLVGHISEYKTEKALRNAVSAENVRSARALARVRAQDGLTEEQRNAATHEVQVYAGIRSTLALIARHSAGLKGERVDAAYKVLKQCDADLFQIFQEQVNADNAAKAAAEALPEAPAGEGEAAVKAA